MQIKMLVMQNEEGLTAKNATILVEAASAYKCRIYLEKGNKKIDAKSIMGVISLGMKHYEKIIIFTDGDDEKEAMQGLEGLFENKFLR